MSSDLGRLGLGVLGAVAAYFTFGASAVALGFAAGSLVGGLLFPPEGTRTEGQRLDDLSIMSSTRGAPLPMLWGSFRVAGNLIDGKKYEERQESEQGGKGFGGPTNSVVTYAYFADLAVTLCDCFRAGPITGVRRIWLNNKIFYDVSDTASADTLTQSAENAKYFKVYKGTGTQLADPTLEAIHGATNVPAYAWTAYIVFTRLPLLNYGNGIPQVSCEVVRGAEVVGNTIEFVDPALTVNSVAVDPINFVTWAIDRSPAANVKIKIYNFTGTLLDTLDMGIASTHHAFIVYVPATAAHGALFCINANINNSLYWYDPISHAQVGVHALPVARSAPPIYNGATDRMWVGSNSSGAQFIDAPINAAIAEVYAPGDANGTVSSGDVDLPVYVPGLQLIVYQRNLVLSVISATTGLLKYSYSATTLLCYGVDAAGGFLYFAEVSADRSIHRVNLSTFAVTTFSNVIPLAPIHGLVYNPYTGLLYALRSNWPVNPTVQTLYAISPATMAVVNTSSWTENKPFRPPIQVASAQYIIADSRVYYPLGGLITNTGVSLSVIVTDLCAEVGLVPADLNVTELTDSVHGYAPPAPLVVSEAIGSLRAGYLFDAVEEDWLLKFPKRGKASLLTIDKADLIPASEPDQTFGVTVQQEVDLPALVSVGYFEPKFEYEQGNQVSRKIATSSQNTVDIGLPVAMSANKAARLSDILRDNAWIERHRYTYTLPPKHLALSPADVVTITVDGNSHVMRLTKVSRATDGTLACEAMRDEVSVYTSARTENPDNFVPQVLGTLSATTGVLLDTPILRDADNASGYYFAASPSDAKPWPGVELFRSVDGGVNYASLFAWTAADPIGSAAGVLAAGPTTVFDNGNTVTVTLLGAAALESLTEAGVLNGGNAAALGAPGRWEIIQYRTATLISGSTYTLSGLLRGRRGTEWAVGAHLAGDRFVALSSALIRRVADSLTDVGLSYRYKPVTIGTSIAATSEQSFTGTGMGLRPYSPVHIAGARDGSNNLTITWIRRSRIDGEMRDSVGTPIGEDTEAYEVDIFNGANVVRTISASTQTASYSAANQTTDGLTPGNPVVLKIYQLSAQVGRGIAGSATV